MTEERSCQNAWHDMKPWTRTAECPSCFEDKGLVTGVVVVLERGLSPAHEYIGEVELDSHGQACVIDWPTDGCVRLYAPLVLRGDTWDYVQKDPRKPPALMPIGTDWTPVSSCEMTEWKVFPVQSIRSAGETLVALYRSEIERHTWPMGERGKRIVAKYQEICAESKKAQSAIRANLVVVPEEAGDAEAARLADMQAKLKGG